MKLVEIGKITNNLDRLRVPLNKKERDDKTKIGLYPYVGANNIQGYIDEYIFDEKILCIAEDGGSWGFNETCAIIMNEKCWVNNHAHVLTAKDNLILEYLKYYLNYTDLTLYINGATRGKLNQKTLSNIKIPLPPLETQQKIAHILDDADKLRQLDKKLIEKYDALGKSLFLEMFGDFIENPLGFEKGELGEILNEKNSIKCGPFGSQLKIGEFIDEGIPVYGIDNVQANKFIDAKPKFISKSKYEDLKAFNVRKNDILITRTGTVGRTCLAPDIDMAVIGPNLLKVRVQNSCFKPEFLAFAFNYSNSIVRQIQMFSPGATVGVYNTGNLKKLKVLIPPIELQNQFANRIEVIEKQKQQAQQSLEKSEELFNSLLQKAFKGELV